MYSMYFEKLSRYDRKDEVCSVAIPFERGLVRDDSLFNINDGQNLLPVQTKITSKWDDGSIKWGQIHFLANLPGNHGKEYFFEISHKPAPKPQYELKLEKTPKGGIEINTGIINVELKGALEDGIFGGVSGKEFTFESNAFAGPIIEKKDGTKFTVRIGEDGWNILESGPIRACAEARGKHYNKDNSYIDFVMRVYAFVGKPWLELEYQIINKEDEKVADLDSMEFIFSQASGKNEVDTAIATSNYLTDIEKSTSDNKEIYKIIDADYLKFDANEHYPETFYGTFFADWKARCGGVCITAYQAYQNFPKAFHADECGIRLEILPKGKHNVEFFQGMAKTHKFLLHFHGYGETAEELNVRSLQYQMPDRPVLENIAFRRANILEDIFVDNKIPKVEQYLLNLADNHGRAYGMLCWGDAPDDGYTSQGRGDGKLVWTNNEYDFPHAAMLMYAKTGQRRMLDYLLVSARHQIDVDICHYSDNPLRLEGQIMHSANHVTEKVSPCHEWVEGLLDYYHITGEKEALEAAIEIGNNVLRILATPRYQGKGGINARETGWALRAIVALYKETYEEKWLEYADTIVGHFEAWKEEYGGWLAPYTDHTTIRVPFMISIAVNSLMRYYKLKPQEKIKTMVVEAMEDLVENCILESGLFYYKELPSLNRTHTNTLLLEALAYAYELTGDKKFLEAGLPTFDFTINKSIGGGTNKTALEDAIVWKGMPSPKSFAQSCHPMAYYYRTAVAAGIL